MGPSKRVITNKSEIPQTEDEKSNEQQQLLAPVKIKCVKCKTRFSRKGTIESDTDGKILPSLQLQRL